MSKYKLTVSIHEGEILSCFCRTIPNCEGCPLDDPESTFNCLKDKDLDKAIEILKEKGIITEENDE